MNLTNKDKVFLKTMLAAVIGYAIIRMEDILEDLDETLPGTAEHVRPVEPVSAKTPEPVFAETAEEPIPKISSEDREALLKGLEGFTSGHRGFEQVLGHWAFDWQNDVSSDYKPHLLSDVLDNHARNLVKFKADSANRKIKVAEFETIALGLINAL